jgi:tRNA(Ile)-lysidine synthase
MLRTVQNTIRRCDMLRCGRHWLVAVSGGADSVSLLLALHALTMRLALRLTAVHLNHRLRGAAAKADADFVRDLCEHLQIPCIMGASDVRRVAARNGLSVEMAARRCRYRFFRKALLQAGADAVATGHTADDQVETVILRLARGAGARGLTGMQPVSEQDGMTVLRPLLSVRRDGVERFLRTRGLAWREDGSNRDPAYLRNRVRHDVLPLLRRSLNPRIDEAVLRSAAILGAEDEYLSTLAGAALADCVHIGGFLDVERLRAQPLCLRRRLLGLWLRRAGLPETHLDFDAVETVDRLLAISRGTDFVELGSGYRLVRRYGRATIEGVAGRQNKGFRTAVRLNGETVIPEARLRMLATVEPGIRRFHGRPGVLPASASLSRVAIGRSRLYVRSWQSGDRITPLGFCGTRKLQDIFVDAKVPRDERERWPVIECRGEIVWLPGYRVAEGWGVNSPDAPAVQLTIRRLGSR